MNMAGWRRERHTRGVAALAGAGVVLALGASASVALAKAPAAPKAPPGVCAVVGQKTENVFTRVVPLSGSTVHPGDLVGADFHDETPLNVTAPDQLQLTLAGPAGTTTLTPTITAEPAYTDGKTGEFKVVRRITATLPWNPAPGSYTATIKGWDTDQTRSQGDCGMASWTFSVQPVPRGSLAGDIVLCASGARVSGGTISVSGPQSRVAAANPISYSQTTPGSYLLSARAPHGYHFVACKASMTIVSSDAATLAVAVRANGSGSATFLVDPNNVVVDPAPRPAPQGAVKAAAVKSMPFTGRGGLLVGAVVGMVLVLLGMTTLLLAARSTRRA